MKPLTKKEIEEIRKNPNKVDWNRISIHQKLSESFIREFKDRVDWNYISMCQKLSEGFIREFKDRVKKESRKGVVKHAIKNSEVKGKELEKFRHESSLKLLYSSPN